MKLSLRALRVLFALSSAFGSVSAIAVPNTVYTALDQPCRLLDTRVPGSIGKLSVSGGNYLFGTSIADISSLNQSGNPLGCGIPPGVVAVSANVNMLSTTIGGNIRMWSTAAGTTGPTAGSAVFNPTAASSSPGVVLFNGGFSNIAINPADGRFYLHVDNGSTDMTINVVGYWTRGVRVKTMTLTSPGSVNLISFKLSNSVNYDPIANPVPGTAVVAGGLIRYTIFATDGGSQIVTEHGTLQYNATPNSITCIAQADDKLHLGTVNSSCNPTFFNPGSQPGIAILDAVTFSSPASILHHYIYFEVEDQTGTDIRYEP